MKMFMLGLGINEYIKGIALYINFRPCWKAIKNFMSPYMAFNLQNYKLEKGILILLLNLKFS